MDGKSLILLQLELLAHLSLPSKRLLVNLCPLLTQNNHTFTTISKQDLDAGSRPEITLLVFEVSETFRRNEMPHAFWQSAHILLITSSYSFLHGSFSTSLLSIVAAICLPVLETRSYGDWLTHNPQLLGNVEFLATENTALPLLGNGYFLSQSIGY